ncbi:MAG: GWxTD domain-containing protein, partial [Gemmatimonadales bacterium]
MRNSESCHPERSGSKAAAQSKDLLRRSRPEARISPLHSTSIGVLLTAILAVASLSAQKPAERAFADSIVALAQSAELAAVSAANARCAGHTDDLARLCHGLLAERKAELTLQRDDAINASDMLTRSVADSPKSPEAWYGLGLVRLQLARDTVFSKGGPLLPVGASNELGAANALVYALKLDPTFAAAANALATTAMPRESSGALKDRVDMLRKVRGILSPGSLAAVAFLERKTGHVDTALALERRALASGKVDSGLIDVAMARDLYRLGKPDEGRKVLIAGAGINTDVAYKAYRQELAWVANPEELAEWDTLPPEHRSAWLADFWAKRDIAEGRADGERLIEHYRRIEYAMVHFPITLPQTGRQRLMSYTPSMGYFEEQQARKCAMRAPDAYQE